GIRARTVTGVQTCALPILETGADALNMGLRFSGHRWLHSPQSLARMAQICGFEVLPTTCAVSTVEKFNGINLRDETNSLSFANRSEERRVGKVGRSRARAA